MNAKQKNIFFGFFVLAIVIFAAALINFFLQTKSRHADRVQATNLIIYTHASFMDSFGPGAELKKEFEKTCACRVEYIDAGGAVTAIERMRLEPSRRVDLLLGLDLLVLARVANTIKLQAIDGPQVKWGEPIKKFVYSRFIPYDWSPMGLIYRKKEVSPVYSWSEAFKKLPDNIMSLPDPTLSTPGLELIYWFFATTQNLQETFNQLKRIVHIYSPSWSTSYGLFKRKQASVTFSYLTSLIYHWQDEKDENYQFMVFSEGHPVQIEYAAIPSACLNCSDAKRFVSFLLSPVAQQILAKKNYMLPVVENIQLDEVYMRLPKIKILGPEKLEDFIRQQSTLLEIWRRSRR